jgi:hypothetical protein
MTMNNSLWLQQEYVSRLSDTKADQAIVDDRQTIRKSYG